MEQVINPNANSEKYIKDTNFHINNLRLKLVFLEKQYSTVIKTKNDEINGLKKKVNELNNTIANKILEIGNLEEVIADKELEISDKDLEISALKFNKTNVVEVNYPQNILKKNKY